MNNNQKRRLAEVGLQLAQEIAKIGQAYLSGGDELVHLFQNVKNLAQQGIEALENKARLN